MDTPTGHGAFLAAMLDRLPDHPALRGLTVRTTDDPAIALLDAAAVAADLLTFHSARIAAEGYLRTAGDQRSLGLLGRLVDHRPRPGLASDTHLAYRLDPRSQPGGADADVLIPRGSRSRSVPVTTGEQPQTFETDADLTARAAWNELAVRRHRPGLLYPDDLGRRAEISVVGTNTLLAAGDRLLFLFGAGDTATRRLVPVARIRVDRDRDVTAIGLPSSPPPSLTELIAELRRWITASGAAAPNPRPVSTLIADVDALVLAPLRAGLDGIATGEAFAARLAEPRERLTEAAAVAGSQQAVADWFDELEAVLADLADRALDLGGIRAEASAEPVRTGRRAASPDDALTSLIALRVTAAPFGARAALQPVRDEQGRVINLTDWPLPGATLTTTRVVFDTAGRMALRAEFIHAQPDGTVQHTEDLPTAAKTFSLGTGRITVTGTAEAVTVDLQAGLPAHQLVINTPGEDRHITVKVDDRTIELAPGKREPIVIDGQEITVSYAAATQPASLEIGIATVPDLSRRTVLPLDAVLPGITAGSAVAVERPGKTGLPLVITRVTEVRTVTYSAFGTTGRGTQLTLEDPWLDEHDVLLSQIRDTTVYAGGEPLRPAGRPLDDDVHGNRVELAELHRDLKPGRTLAVTGPAGTEIAFIAAVEHGTDPQTPGDHPHTTLVLTGDLDGRYRRDTIRILGNVVAASNGESRDEPIGSGDATAAGQTFTLWQEPLTWLPDPGPSGARPVLEIRIDGLLWHRVDSLAGRGPGERVYVLGTTPDGRTTVTFGDGVHGARLPTGQENVRARYRFGTGAAGNLPAGRITQAVTRPLGVTGVLNPVPATGGTDPDGPGLARRRIPLAVATLDRLLSTHDYAEFARSRVGIGRAAARELFDGRRRIVHVTVAGVDDVEITADSDLLPALRAALAGHGDPRLPVRVDVRELLALRLVAEVRVAPDHTWEIVGPRLRQALLHRLGYPGRDLGRDAYLSEVMAVADAVTGVDYIDVAVFSTTGGPAEALSEIRAQHARTVKKIHRVTATGGQTLTQVAAAAGISLAELVRLNPGITGVRSLPAGRAVTTFRGIRPAQLATLAPAGLTLTELR
ncbi:putative baseplate assembly protein [Actinoplanes sp. GCM10030250]|uniref:putative baseplate assembly protein n=1 Tax=Actinoplanes sp. GCM10030250 TaxID=3273376 RepID=UPI00360A955D